MKLYDVPRESWVVIRNKPTIPPAHREFEDGEKIFFDHLDGMYSFCKDVDGNIVHLSASAEVDICDSPSNKSSKGV